MKGHCWWVMMNSSLCNSVFLETVSIRHYNYYILLATLQHKFCSRVIQLFIMYATVYHYAATVQRNYCTAIYICTLYATTYLLYVHTYVLLCLTKQMLCGSLVFDFNSMTFLKWAPLSLVISLCVATTKAIMKPSAESIFIVEECCRMIPLIITPWF